MPSLRLRTTRRQREETQMYLSRTHLRRVRAEDKERSTSGDPDVSSLDLLQQRRSERNQKEVPASDVVIKISVDRRRIWSHIPRYTCFAADCTETGHKGRLLPCKCRYVLCPVHANERKPMLKLVRDHPDHIFGGL